MRSVLVFNVSNRISNRFLLCRMLAASARKMHHDGVSTSQCINKSLLVLQSAPQELAESRPAAAAGHVEESLAENVPVATP